jgi:hypothetical protein
MSTQGTRLLSPLPQSEFLQLNSGLVDDIKYLVKRITTCWHRKLSRPFTHGTHSYRVCLRCGMRRDFDLQAWKSTGRFYSPSIDRSKSQ